MTKYQFIPKDVDINALVDDTTIKINNDGKLAVVYNPLVNYDNLTYSTSNHSGSRPNVVLDISGEGIVYSCLAGGNNDSNIRITIDGTAYTIQQVGLSTKSAYNNSLNKVYRADAPVPFKFNTSLKVECGISGGTVAYESSVQVVYEVF
jgi:hypothetical protein